MLTTLRNLLLFAVTIAGAAAFATPAKADHFDYRYDRLDRLASELESESQTLAIELRRFRSSDRNLRLASREVSNIARDARHIHALVHSGGNLNHLHADVVSLQDEVHHIQEHLAPYGHFASHVRRMDSLVHAIDDAIHDLEHRHTVRRPVVVPYNNQYNRGGVTIGNGGFSIRLGR